MEFLLVILLLFPFLISTLCTFIFYDAPFYVKKSIVRDMLFLNFYTIMLIGITILIPCIHPIIINNVVYFTIYALFLFWPYYISIYYYYWFYKQAHKECPNCGSTKTVKLNDSDGEFSDMHFHCKHCNKDFTIKKSHSGCWPD